MLSLLFVCCGVIKFHLSPTHTYTSSTFPIDHDLVVKKPTYKRGPKLHPPRQFPAPKSTIYPSPGVATEDWDISLLCEFHAE